MSVALRQTLKAMISTTVFTVVVIDVTRGCARDEAP